MKMMVVDVDNLENESNTGTKMRNKMKFQKINKTTSSEMIVEQILEQVREGVLGPGQKLPPERELAEMFGVCRSSVREAARALTLMGYLDVYQGKGAFLKENIPDEDLSTDRLNQAFIAVDSLDLVDIRNVLECKAASLAATRADSTQTAALDRAVMKMSALVDQKAGFYKADLEFHQALARASNNAVLMEIMNLLWTKIVRDRDDFLGFSGEKQECLNTARKVAAAVGAGSSEEAAGAMSEHLNVVSTDIAETLEEL